MPLAAAGLTPRTGATDMTRICRSILIGDALIYSTYSELRNAPTNRARRGHCARFLFSAGILMARLSVFPGWEVHCLCGWLRRFTPVRGKNPATLIPRIGGGSQPQSETQPEIFVLPGNHRSSRAIESFEIKRSARVAHHSGCLGNLRRDLVKPLILRRIGRSGGGEEGRTEEQDSKASGGAAEIKY